MTWTKKWCAYTVAAIALLMCATPIRADVRDAADYFSDQAEQDANRQIEKIKRERGKDVIVETVAEVQNVPQPRRERDDFFEAEVQRRGKVAGVDGVYILVSRNPEYLYVGVDPKTQKDAFTLADRGLVRGELLKRFTARDFDGGLASGLRLIDERLAANASGAAPRSAAGGAPTGASGTEAPQPAPTGGVCGMAGGLGGALCLALGVLGIFVIVRALARRQTMNPGQGRPMYDPRTGQPMDPNYGGPGYPQPGAGGGFGRGLMGGVLGGMAGGYLYDQMRGGGNEAQAATPPPDTGAAPLDPGANPSDPGADFGGGDFGGGDFGGGDFGGGDFGGGDSGGGGD